MSGLASHSQLSPAVPANSLKLPAYWPTEPELWFSVVEAVFSTAKPQIKEESLKFHHVLGVLPLEIVQEVADIIKARDPKIPYTKLRNEIIHRTSHIKLKDLFSGLELGSKTPTELLDQMQTLTSGLGYDEKVLKDTFIELMPLSSQPLLVLANHKSVAEIARIADELHKLYNLVDEYKQAKTGATKNSWDTRTTLETLGKSIVELQKQVQSLTIYIKHRDTSCNESETRSESSITDCKHQNNVPSIPVPQVELEPEVAIPEHYCYYHKQFGFEARNCSPPCNFVEVNFGVSDDE